jgi:hypothetical protein
MKPPITLKLNSTQLIHLEKVLDYVYSTEALHFEEHCNAGGRPEDHIYFSALVMNGVMNDETTVLYGDAEIDVSCDETKS